MPAGGKNQAKYALHASCEDWSHGRPVERLRAFTSRLKVLGNAVYFKINLF
jgi:hypothetical protein